MRVVLFAHSLVSDWNHGNAHFLRGLVSEMAREGIHASVYEPGDAWSATNLIKDQGPQALNGYKGAYPELTSHPYHLPSLDLDEALTSADVVLVHEWSDPELVKAVGTHRRLTGGYRLFFHDTHHRSVTAPQEMSRYDLSDYDGVLAFGSVIRDIYLQRGWAKRAWTWHEAADPYIFKPLDGAKQYDLVWIGNWGDEERTKELQEFLLDPVQRMGLKAKVWGVRYPDHALKSLEQAGIDYGGYLPNYDAPQVFAQARMTVHVPRRPYAEALPGIPTIRVFEALASGIPLISAPWSDREGLFNGEQDYLTVGSGAQMEAAMRSILEDPDAALYRAQHGRETILARHTCAHRLRELLEIANSVPIEMGGSLL